MKKYEIVYADPPWAYRTYSKKGQGRSAESHYPTMSVEDIKALPVAEIVAKDCALFMWITFPCLQEALEVIRAWGFEYKTVAFVWVKQNRKADSLFWGMGYWTRANAEMCILATKGHPKRLSSGVHQIIMSHNSTVKSRTRPVTASFSSWGTFPVSNSLPVSLPKDGMYGAMRSNVTLICLWRPPHAAAKTRIAQGSECVCAPASPSSQAGGRSQVFHRLRSERRACRCCDCRTPGEPLSG